MTSAISLAPQTVMNTRGRNFEESTSRRQEIRRRHQCAFDGGNFRACFGDDIVRDGMGTEEQYVGSDILGGILTCSPIGVLLPERSCPPKTCT